MKTTIDVHDELLTRAKRHAKATGRPVRALVEEGLRLMLASTETRRRYRMPDLRVGEPNADNPLAGFFMAGTARGDLR